MRWRDARDRDPRQGLKPKPATGRPAKLTPSQKKRLTKLLLKGAMASGYRTELWTTARIAEIINRNFGVTYHRDHVGRLLASLGFSYQKPERRALGRDDKAIEEWKRKEWPWVKKRSAAGRPHSVCGRIRIFEGAAGQKHLGAYGADTGCPPPSGPPAHLGDIGPVGQP